MLTLLYMPSNSAAPRGLGSERALCGWPLGLGRLCSPNAANRPGPVLSRRRSSRAAKEPPRTRSPARKAIAPESRPGLESPAIQLRRPPLNRQVIHHDIFLAIARRRQHEPVGLNDLVVAVA